MGLQLSVSHKSVGVCVLQHSHTTLILPVSKTTSVVCDSFKAKTCDLLTPTWSLALKS